jgi:phosphoribosylformylglycinamidine cyclo-ligase
LQKHGAISDEDMYFTYNMGIGFCVILAPEDADASHAIALKHQSRSYTIGYAVHDPEKKVHIPSLKLVGFEDKFSRT